MKQKTELSGLGGWLLLPMLGLMLLPAKFGAFLATSSYQLVKEGSWELLTTPGNRGYHPLREPLIIFEILGNGAFLVAAIALLASLSRKHHRFPKLMIAFLVLLLAFVAVDFFVANRMPAVAAGPDPSSMNELIGAVLGVAIWIPYFLKSVRVRNTFTDGRPGQGAGGQGPSACLASDAGVAEGADSRDACPKCGGDLYPSDKHTFTGEVWWEYTCRTCGHQVQVNGGKALWQVLHDAAQDADRAKEKP